MPFFFQRKNNFIEFCLGNLNIVFEMTKFCPGKYMKKQAEYISELSC